MRVRAAFQRSTTLCFSLAALLFTSVLTSCLSFDGATPPASLTIQVERPEGFSATAALAGRTVVLTAQGDTLRALTDEQGQAHFSNLVPGSYNISTAWQLTAEEYRQATQQASDDNDFVVSGNLSAQVVSDATPRLTLPTHAAQLSSLLISKVYASGSKDANNRNYGAGKFVELFNNSDRAIRLSDFGIGLLESGSTPAYALGITPEYLYLKQAFRFPDDGKMLAPGATVLVVNSAINHPANNAPQEYDLSAADYETKDASGRTVNNPQTPAMELVFTSWPQVTQMNLVQGGPTSIVIFRWHDATSWAKVYANGRSSGQEYLRMPIAAAIDGIDIIKYSPTNGADLTSKRLYPILDAGFTHISSASGWNGEVTYRRTAPSNASTVGAPATGNATAAGTSRIYLRDTNNSSADCATAASLAPRTFPTDN